jgi:hypothetical protein
MVKSILYDYLMANGMEKYVLQFKLEPFTINVLSINRTLMDKIVSLVRMSYKEDLLELRAKTRHLYDLHMTYNTDEVKAFYCNKDHVLEIISLVRQDERASTFNKEYPYKERWSRAPLFDLLQKKEIQESYETNFGKEFVYGDLPKYEDVLSTIAKIRQHLEDVGE